MVKLCGFCKFHECINNDGLICRRVVKFYEIENWFVACRDGFRDRREKGKQSINIKVERRRSGQVANA